MARNFYEFARGEGTCYNGAMQNGNNHNSPKRRADKNKTGAALIVVMWLVVLMSLLVWGFVAEMHIEAGISVYARNRLKAKAIARGGVEYAKFLLAKSFENSALKESDEAKEAVRILAANLSRGIAATAVEVPMGDGKAKIDILPETGRRNVNLLSDEDWEELLDQTNIPEELWPELIDCFSDWIDADDDHRLNGAEKDDPFYKKRGYEPKNAPLDTIDELLLIKGFTPEIVYGGPSSIPKGEPFTGIARLLTTYGDGKVNINTASREVLMTLPDIDEWIVEDILKYRLGDDGIPNTEDDGFASVAEAMSKTRLPAHLQDRISVSDRRYVRVISIGEVENVMSGIWAIFLVDARTITPIYWREENMQ